MRSAIVVTILLIFSAQQAHSLEMRCQVGSTPYKVTVEDDADYVVFVEDYTFSFSEPTPVKLPIVERAETFLVLDNGNPRIRGVLHLSPEARIEAYEDGKLLQVDPCRIDKP
jgi:hypothetical protein